MVLRDGTQISQNRNIRDDCNQQHQESGPRLELNQLVTLENHHLTSSHCKHFHTPRARLTVMSGEMRAVRGNALNNSAMGQALRETKITTL